MLNKLMWSFFGVLVTVLLGTSVYFANARTEFESTPIITPAPIAVEQPITNEPVIVPEDQLAVIKKGRDALAKLAQTSATAARLLQFYDLNAIRGRMVPDGVQVAEEPRTNEVFVVAGNPHFRFEADTTETAAEFDCSHRVMTFHAVEFDTLVTGTFVGHEIVHAMDCIIGGEPIVPRSHPEWLAGERNAYGTVYMMLDEHTYGQWGKLVEDSRQRRVATMIQDGRRPESFFFGQTPGDVEEIKRLFGANLDDFSLGSLTIQLDIDAGMINCMVQAEANGHDPAFGEEAQLRFLDTFYKTRTSGTY